MTSLSLHAISVYISLFVHQRLQFASKIVWIFISVVQNVTPGYKIQLHIHSKIKEIMMLFLDIVKTMHIWNQSL